MKARKKRPVPSTQSARPVIGPHRQTAGRKWLFRLAALVGMPALIFGLLELVLRLAGYGYPTDFFIKSPVSGQGDMVENRQFSRRYFSLALMRIPKPVAFSPIKAPRTLRVFVFGESAAEGDPSPAFGFARILKVLLQDRLPDREVEIINTAVTAINSHVILPIAREAAHYSGDVWVIYMGNNEVVGPFGSGTVFGAQTPPLPLIRANIALKATRSGQLLDSMLEGISRPGSPDEWAGMEMFLKQQIRRDDPRMASVYAHFGRNLADIIELGLRSGSKLVISTVGSNLKDCAPLGSQHRPDLAAKETTAWEKTYQAGVAFEDQGKWAEAIAEFQRASQLDDQYADLHFRLGRCHAALDQRELAHRHYELARDLDTLRFRADSRINQIIRQVAAGAEARGVRLADAEEALARDSAAGVPGQEWFYEHVHLTFPGNYLVARQLAGQVMKVLAKPAASPATSAGESFLTVDECAQRLGLTDYSRLQMLEEMTRRTSRPPFTQQLDHSVQIARREKLVSELRQREQTNFQAIAEVFTQALSHAPEDWQLHDQFAGALLQHGDRTNAMIHWQRVIRLLPHRTQTYDLLASVLIEQERFEEAEGVCENALRIQPDYVEALIDLGRVRLGQHRAEEAVALFRRSVSAEPQSARPRNHLGLALLQLGKGAEAETVFRAALKTEPDFLPAKLNLGSALLAQGKGQDAIEHYRQLLSAEPRNKTLRIAFARTLSQLKRLDEAIEQYSELVRKEPEDFETRYALGNALLRLSRVSDAEEHFAAAIRLRPDSAESHFNYGAILARQGKASAAQAQFEETLRLKPDFTLAHLNLARTLAEQGRSSAAISHLREVLRLDPQNGEARQLLESALGRQNGGR